MIKTDNTSEDLDMKDPPLNLTAEMYLSVIFPAFNESERLPATLEDTISYLEEKQLKVSHFGSEIIIVDDGSHDDT